MLKSIPPILSPELLKILMEMGHGDELVIADGNFPAASHAQRLVRLDGHGVPEVLDAVLSLLPLDQYVNQPAAVMGVVPGDPVVPVIWEQYAALTEKHEGKTIMLEELERFAFYERAKQAYAIVATSERAQYANIIVKKGCVL
ncbi:L-fucose mutarotase [Paenibacillus cellulosilyticus]|uniref:L-fucose mutarotase n=1 Tax=Paenibacillus cellulosilyticus TaxID=375489 RepID=A0A2V2YWE6_9BACL|nr:RbsD/FucU domain-containing protein [Paenibacillus cellulosilyticus]PWW05696.1 L-fucose mutarotase [Paenibacillus cellulosilyticus]QKS45284.1 fucose isomerase [Paenibacillus cellulosilyticus]